MNIIYVAFIAYVILSAVPVYLLFRWKRKHERDVKHLALQSGKMAVAQLNQTLLISDLSKRVVSLEPNSDQAEESKTQ